MTHPTDERLVQVLLEGSGRDPAARRVQEHLDGCARCAGRLHSLEEVVTALRSDRDAEPPAEWVARAIALRSGGVFGRARERLRAWAAGLAEEAARLVADSAAAGGAPALAGLRAAGGGRRVRFETGDVELDLAIEPVGGGAVVTGQFLGLSEPPAPVGRARWLLAAGETPLEGETDELGEFRVELPRASGFSVRLAHGDGILLFEVPPAPDARTRS